MSTQENGNVGKIVEIKGVVIDAVFPDELPEINNAVSIERPDDGSTLIAEVNSTSATTASARSRWTPPTASRGIEVTDTGGPITCPSAIRRWAASGT